MVAARACKTLKDNGEPCRAPPLHDGEFCFVHAPEYAAEMQEARRLGGLRRRRERTVAGAYDVESLDTVAGIRRVLEIVTFDGLGMEISIPRGRLLVSTMQVAAKLLETGELEQRGAELESIIKPRIEAAKGQRR